MATDLLKGVDLRRFIGPFFRCHDVFVPVWVPIFDVPDITFRVLQDTDGDGDEELIYGEGHFDVRWNAGAIPDQVIHAWPNARTGIDCGPTDIPCGNVPAIVLAGRLPVTGDPSVFDGTLGDPSAGYAQRTNRPRTGGDFAGAPITPGRAPLCWTLPLYGCNETTAGATHYRILYRFSPDGGASFTAPTPFTGLTWPLYRLNGMGIGEWHYPSADAQGWYPIALPGGPNPWLPQKLLLDWPTTGFADGLYGLTLQVGAGGDPISPVLGRGRHRRRQQRTDRADHRGAQLCGRRALHADQRDLPGGEARRRAAGRVFPGANGGGARHLRSAELFASDCGDGSFEFVSGSGGIAVGTLYRHWHQDPADNDQLLEVIYRLPAGAAQGTYGFNGYVVSRAFNPVGGDTGHLQIPPFAYDPDYIHIHPSIAFSVFNANP